MAQELIQWVRVAKEEVSLPSPLFAIQQTLVLVTSLLELTELSNLAWNSPLTFLIVIFCAILVSCVEKGTYTPWGEAAQPPSSC